jgi:hypothetical protein
MKLYCAMCREEKEEKEFTNFDKNPALKDRQGRTSLCRECASQYVEDRGNTLDALREVLRLQDIPYLDSFGESAMKVYEKKRKCTNVVIKKNVFDDTETIEGTESIQLQSTIYTCYTSRLGVMPKKYINFSFSDGIRSEDGVEKEDTPNEDDDSKEAKSATRYLVKLYGDEIFNDKSRLPKAVMLTMEEFGLHKNNTTKRQNKFKLKNHIIALIDEGILNKDDYGFIFDSDEKSNIQQDVMASSDALEIERVARPKFEVDEALRIKWGYEFKDSDIYKFENKYADLIKNYEIKTSAHDEFLRLACVASVRGQECMANNLVDEAKTWMGMFKDLTSAGKLQPQQMSKADLSGGLNNFGEFFKSVEQATGVIEILPEFKKAPKDDADFVIYCLVQYVRRLKGLPDCKYEEIWQFYDEIAKQFDSGDTRSLADEIMSDFIDSENENEGDEDGE